MHASRSLVLLLAVAWSCSSTEHSTARAPSTDIAYTLELSQDPELAVAVAIDMLGDADGETTLELSEGWGGVQDPGSDVRGLAVTGADGRELPLEHPAGHRWSVRHAPGEALRVSYRLERSPAPGWNREDRHYYQVIVMPGLFHMIGSNGLLHPTRLEGGEACDIRLAWNGFQEAGWSVITSHTPGAEEVSLHMPLEAFLHGLFLAGDLQLEQRSIRGRPLHVAVSGTDWAFTSGEFADLCARVVELEREFFDDFEYPQYLISAIPVGERQGGSTSIGGTGLTSSFAMFLLPGAGLAPPEGNQVVRILAHEMFHHWDGSVVQVAEPEEHLYWFSEGFTDFFARRLLYRGGFLTLDEFAESVDDKLTSYWLSPERDAPASRVREAFWSDPEVQRLPYLRGDLIAMALDAAIRERTDGAQSLDDLMRELVVRSRGEHGPWTADDLFAEFASFAGEDAARALRATAEDGAPLAVGPQWFAPCLEYALAERARFDLGFDFEATRARGEIVGVRAGSSAESAGLCDGQRVGGFSVGFGDAERPVSITLIEGDARRDIDYLPRGAVQVVPSFRPAAERPSGVCRFL